MAHTHTHTCIFEHVGQTNTNNTVMSPVSLRVSHLILVDPWGFQERPKVQAEQNQGDEVNKKPGPPRWVKAVASVVSLFNPLAIIRAAGPWGESSGSETLCSHFEGSTELTALAVGFRSWPGEQIPARFQKEI